MRHPARPDRNPRSRLETTQAAETVVLPSRLWGGEQTEYAATSWKNGNVVRDQTLIFSSARTRSTAGRLTMRSLNAV